jgi:adenylate cyclase
MREDGGNIVVCHAAEGVPRHDLVDAARLDVPRAQHFLEQRNVVVGNVARVRREVGAGHPAPLRTETDGPAFDRMRARVEAVASRTGMSRVFRLCGVDVYEVLDCRSVNQEGRSEIVPQAESMRELEAFTERLGSCEGLDALLSTALEALADLFGHRHSFVTFPDEDGTRLYTGASYGFDPSGVGSEVVVGEGMLGLAAARRSVVRVTNLALDRVVARAVRSGIERRG